MFDPTNATSTHEAAMMSRLPKAVREKAVRDGRKPFDHEPLWPMLLGVAVILVYGLMIVTALLWPGA